MNILSLFDGISCGRLALERAGIKVDKYFASEIDRYAIQVAKKNFPDTIHIGSVIDVSYSENHLRVETPNEDDCPSGWEVPIDIHMIIWGSPCQDLSIAKKWGQWLQGEKSSLFFEYVRLLREVKPKYFLLENVASMKKADKEEITRILWVEPVMINSALVSAQNRKRLYWFWELQSDGSYKRIDVEQPEDKWIVLKDILQTDWECDIKSYCIPASYHKENTKSLVKRNKTGLMVRVWQFNSGGQWDRVYSPEWKSVSLSANGWGRGAKTGLYSIYNQAFHEDKSMSLWTNSQCPTAKTWQIVIQPPIIRKLTPIECERLQTLPDNYTEGVSNTQRYKAIWNGWTVDVIAHIFSYIK